MLYTQLMGGHYCECHRVLPTLSGKLGGGGGSLSTRVPCHCVRNYKQRIKRVRSTSRLAAFIYRQDWSFPSRQQLQVQLGRRSYRIIGGYKRRLGVWGTEVSQRGLGRSPGTWVWWTKSPRIWSFFLWNYTHNICIKIQQTTVVAVTG